MLTPHALPLSPTAIGHLSSSWRDDGTWSTIQVLAHRFSESDEYGELEKLIRWHHLLLAAGNFKRRGGRIVPLPLPEPLGAQPVPPTVVIPGMDPSVATDSEASEPWDLYLSVDDEGSWRQLERIRGLGVATTTVLLAALWPMSHAIMDRRSLNAATALASHAGFNNPLWAEGIRFESITSVKVTWPHYDWYRGCVLKTQHALRENGEDVLPVHVERSLYVLDRAATRPKQTWTDYIPALLEHLPVA